MREFRTEGTHFTINGRPIHLRGMVENCEFPLTGYAPMDEASWERVFRIARSYGLNHTSLSYCPPEAAFKAADRVGFYLQPEGPSWANHGSSLGDGKPIDQFIFDETNRMVRYYGNYPCFCMLAYGNEPRGAHQVEYLTRFIDHWKAKDRRRVYTGADVGMSRRWCRLTTIWSNRVREGSTGHPCPNRRRTTRPSSGNSTCSMSPMRWVSGASFPTFRDTEHTGVYKARNFELFRDLLQRQGMGDEARRFLMASGKLQALCYKAEIEKSLRTKGSAGFQLLCLTDYSGQGTALVGLLNALWQEKGYMTAKEFRRFCNSTVPLTRLPKFVYLSDDTLTAPVELYHYGRMPLHNAVIDWKLNDAAGAVLETGTFLPTAVPIGSCSLRSQEIRVPPAHLPALHPSSPNRIR